MAERFNQETDPRWNTEAGTLPNPTSNFSKEMAKFEQFPSQYGSPGNPYRYREFPRMVYRAELWKGKPVCMAAPVDPYEFPRAEELQRAEDQARRFTERCQLIVKDEAELQKARENGYRDTPDEAVAYLTGRQRAEGQAAAERHYADRNMSESAKAEAKAEEARIFSEQGRQTGEIPAKRRGRPRKNAAA